METEQPTWAERQARKMEYVVVSANAIESYAPTLDDAFADYLRVKSYMSPKVYRRISLEEVSKEDRVSYFVLVRGTRHTAMRTDTTASIKEWFPIFNNDPADPLRIYELVDISAQLAAEEARKTARLEAEEREQERQRQLQMERIRARWPSLLDIFRASHHPSLLLNQRCADGDGFIYDTNHLVWKCFRGPYRFNPHQKPINIDENNFTFRDVEGRVHVLTAFQLQPLTVEEL